MSTTDELLEEMLEDAEEYATPVTDDDLQFWIDEHLRVISIPKNGVVAGVEGDKNVNKIKFGMNRYYHGFDMSTFSGRILYSNAKGNKNYYNITDMQASGSTITFSWLVDADAVQYMGKTAFVVYLFKIQGSELRQKFYSTLATLKVLEGLEVDSAVPVEKQTDIIERMKEEISAYAEEVKKSLPADYTAMTEQVSSLKEEIDDIAVKEYAEMQVEFIEGSYIPYFNQHTITENSNAKYLKISCKSGEKYKIHTKNFYDGRAYALYSGENDYATEYYQGTGMTEVTEEITIPEGVTTLVVNSEILFSAKVEKYRINNKNYYAEKKMVELEIMRNEHEKEYFYSSCINLINSENLLSDKAILFQVGRKYEMTDSPGYYALKSLIPVQEGENYTLLASYARAIIYNSDLTVIDSKYEGAGPVVFTIPAGGAFLSCFWQSAKSIAGLYKGDRGGIDFISPNVFLGKTTSINRLNWCAFGDSLTDKNTLKNEKSGTRNYVDFIQWSTGLNVTNLGKGGTGYMADNGYQQSFVDRMSQIPTNSNIITCFGSFNDASKAKEHIGTIGDNTKDTLYGCLNLFVTGVQNHCPDSIIGLITPTPWSVYNDVNGDSEFAEQYVDAIINIAKKYGLPLLDLYHSSGLRPWDSAFKEKYFKDDTGDGIAEGVHPLQKTHRKYIAPQVENFIRSIANTYISISY